MKIFGRGHRQSSHIMFCLSFSDWVHTLPAQIQGIKINILIIKQWEKLNWSTEDLLVNTLQNFYLNIRFWDILLQCIKVFKGSSIFWILGSWWVVPVPAVIGWKVGYTCIGIGLWQGFLWKNIIIIVTTINIYHENQMYRYLNTFNKL